MIIHKNIVSFDSNNPINIFKNLAGGGEFTSTITLGGDGSNVEIHELNIGGSYGNSGTKLFSNGDIKSDGILIVDDESTFKSNLTIYGNILAGETTMDKEIFATRSDTLGPTNGTITIGSDGTHVKVYYLEVGEAGSKAYIDNQGKITAQDLMVKGDIITTVDEDKNIFTDVSTGKSITIGGPSSTVYMPSTVHIGGGFVSGTGITFNGTGNGFFNADILVNGVFTANSVTLHGDILSDVDEDKKIFTEVTSNSITIGAVVDSTSKVVVNALNVGGSGEGYTEGGAIQVRRYIRTEISAQTVQSSQKVRLLLGATSS